MTLNFDHRPILKAILFTIWIILFFLMCSCSPTRKASRKLQRANKLIERAKILDPSVSMVRTVKVLDTLYIEAIRVDTSFIDIGDTIRVENERLRYVYKRDTITNEVFIDVECKADTVIRELRIPSETLIIKQSFYDLVGLDRQWKIILFWIVLSIVFIFLILLYIKKTFSIIL